MKFSSNTSSKETIEHVNIIDLLGNKIAFYTLRNNTKTIDVSNLKQGIYLLEVTSNTGKTLTQKLIIN